MRPLPRSPLPLLLALGLSAAACGRTPDGVVHLDADGAAPAAFADRPRTQLGSESRYVLGGHPAIALRARDGQTFAESGDLALDAEIPAALADAESLRLDGWVSIRDPAQKGASLVAQREGKRITVTAPPFLVRRQDGALPKTARMPLTLPPEFRQEPALVSVVARRMPSGPTETFTTTAATVGPGMRLRFGLAVEPPGWAEGWPPVRFRVYAQPTAGDRIGPLFERTLDPAADPRDQRWWDHSIGLDRVRGQTVRFVFEATALADAAGATVDRSFAVVSVPELHVPTAKPPRRNVVLVSLDTLRARELGCYGQPRPLSPTIDTRVAAAGAVVKTAVTPSPFTPPSHMTMLTGLSPCTHRVFGVHTRLGPEYVTLAEQMRRSGYHTAAFTEDAYLIAANGFERGFDTYAENRSRETASPGFALETFDSASRWIAAHAREPFFLFIHTYQVHEPYAPPRAYAPLFPENAANGSQKVRDLDNYDREVRYTDDLFGGVLDALEAAGIADETIVVITADHGEGFGEHFWTGHGKDVHDEAILVPMLVRAPGLVAPGQTVDVPVGLVDVTPTILDLAGLPPLANIEGQSFARLLGAGGPAFQERPLVSLAFGNEEGVTMAHGIRTRTHKYLAFRNPPLTRFYDLLADPLEQHELPTDGNPAAAAMAAELERTLAACEAEGKRRVVGERAVDLPDWFVNREQIEEAMQKLKSLGYVQ